jgi:hypothetical protein
MDAGFVFTSIHLIGIGIGIGIAIGFSRLSLNKAAG